MNNINVIFLLFCVKFVASSVDSQYLKCLVCQATINEIENEISKVDPKITVQVSGYRLDSSGNTKVKTVPQIQSELFLSELLDGICKKLDDYVRAKWKSNGQLTLLRLMNLDGQMNSDISRVDIIQDDDINRSLKYYCEGIVDDNEDAIIRHYKNNSDNIDIRICSEEAKLCPHTLPEPDNDYDPFEDEL